jgi:hypothetical protein
MERLGRNENYRAKPISADFRHSLVVARQDREERRLRLSAVAGLDPATHAAAANRPPGGRKALRT